MSYRRDADIDVSWKLNARKKSDKDFVLPKKERLLCWIADSNDLRANSGERYAYFIELVKHIKVDLFDQASDALKGDNYFLTISSCKCFLSFENSIHRDYRNIYWASCSWHCANSFWPDEKELWEICPECFLYSCKWLSWCCRTGWGPPEAR